MTSHNPYLPQGREIEIFKTAAANRLPILIKGPTGCGKTRFVEHMAERLGRSVHTIACHDDLCRGHLLAGRSANPGGARRRYLLPR